ncbi:RICIN domain-containing protein [Streptomyces sp. NPDC101209]|uniref:RICIN domain-containing protein n=1 Tax=Streptomyces sp. NPDC101209 TaxID=3366129 RepID=UPI0038038E2D
MKWLGGSGTTTPPDDTLPGTSWSSLRNVGSGACVDAHAAATANGTAFQQHACNGAEAEQFRLAAPTRHGGQNQQWLPVKEAAGRYHFTARRSDKGLTAEDNAANSKQLTSACATARPHRALQRPPPDPAPGWPPGSVAGSAVLGIHAEGARWPAPNERRRPRAAHPGAPAARAAGRDQPQAPDPADEGVPGAVPHPRGHYRRQQTGGAGHPESRARLRRSQGRPMVGAARRTGCPPSWTTSTLRHEPTAFSPTDTMPLSTRAKLLMSIQSVSALLTSLLVIAGPSASCTDRPPAAGLRTAPAAPSQPVFREGAVGVNPP